MSQTLIENIFNISPDAVSKMVGYTAEEISKIEKLYDISVNGELKCFLMRAGRSDGGLVGDDPFRIYCPLKNVRSQFLFQKIFRDDLKELGLTEYLNRPFVVSYEMQCDYFFLQTGLSGTQYVYVFYENESKILNTGMTLNEYLLDVLQRYPLGGPICRGELIVV